MPYAAREHRVDVVDAAVSLASKILAFPVGDDTDENVDMDVITIRAIAGTGQWTAVVSSSGPIGGPLKLLYQVM